MTAQGGQRPWRCEGPGCRLRLGWVVRAPAGEAPRWRLLKAACQVIDFDDHRLFVVCALCGHVNVWHFRP